MHFSISRIVQAESVRGSSQLISDKPFEYSDNIISNSANQLGGFIMLQTFTITCSAILVCVFIHFECLTLLDKLSKRWQASYRKSIAILLLGAIMTHVIEIWCFAFAYELLFEFDGTGHLIGVQTPELLDYSYFSFVCYTSLGFGDIVPAGYVRFMAGSEALTGLVLITWTASFMFMHMERYWRRKPSD